MQLPKDLKPGKWVLGWRWVSAAATARVCAVTAAALEAARADAFGPVLGLRGEQPGVAELRGCAHQGRPDGARRAAPRRR